MGNYQDFLKKLYEKGIFWSYDPENLALLPPSTVIEHTLIYADVPEIKQLFQHFDFQLIKTTWEKTILPDSRYKKLNYYLARFFFKIKNPRQLLNNHPHESRLERLQNLIAQDA